MATFEENGIILPDFRNLEESDEKKLSLSKFAKYMDKLFLNYLTTIHPTLHKCTLYSHYISDYYITIDFNILKYVIPRPIYEKLKICKATPSIRFYVIPLILQLNEKDSHANVMIVDNKLKTIELYEPHGSKFSSKHIIFDLETHIRNLIPIISSSRSHYKFINVHNQCPTGFQTKQHSLDKNIGHCVAWTLFFIHIRLYNLNKSSFELISYFNKYPIKKLDSYIKKYMTLIDNETKNVKKTYRDVYYDFNLTSDELNKAKELIIEKVHKYLNNVKLLVSREYTPDANKLALEHYVKKIFREFIVFSKFDFFDKLYFQVINNFFNKQNKRRKHE